MSHSILCVCLGNICRSPSAQAALQRAMPLAQVDSAGTSDWHIGAAPYGPMQDAARAAGLDLSDQAARQVARDDFTRFDLILAMDRNNLAELQAIRPEDATARLALFLDVEGTGPADVPDPYYTRDFAGVLALIDRTAQSWATALSKAD